MPIYAYRCAACGHTKDVLRKLSDPPLAECPACGEPRFEKQVTAAGFQLKGSGWYVTDFRNPPAAPAPTTVAAKTEADKPADGKADKPDKAEKGEKADKSARAGEGGPPASTAAVAPAAPAPAAPATAPSPAAAPGPAGDAR